MPRGAWLCSRNVSKLFSGSYLVKQQIAERNKKPAMLAGMRV
jgi:hypothetical protein